MYNSWTVVRRGATSSRVFNLNQSLMKTILDNLCIHFELLVKPAPNIGKRNEIKFKTWKGWKMDEWDEQCRHREPSAGLYT